MQNTPRKTSIKNKYKFYQPISRYSKATFSLISFVQTISKLIMEHSVKFEMYILKTISHGSIFFMHNEKFGHFTLLFYSGRQRNVPRIIMHLHSHCSAHCAATRTSIPVAVAVVVLNSVMLIHAAAIIGALSWSAIRSQGFSLWIWEGRPPKFKGKSPGNEVAICASQIFSQS